MQASNIQTKLKHTVMALTATTALCSVATSGVAQEVSVFDEIVVTATKRGGLGLQDVPFAVQAVSGDALSKRGAVDFDDFFRQIPGVAVFDQGPGDKRYIIRGVNSTGAGTVGLYMDEVIITGENAQDGGGRQPDIKLFDIDRVEVLKGPQGTTFGSSSLSGAIRYITKKPDLTEVQAAGSVSLRKTEGASLGWNMESAVSLPVVENKLAVRVAGYYLDEKGYIDNVLADNVNNEKTYAGRLTLLAEPTDKLTFSLMAMYQDMKTDGPGYFNRVDYTGAPISQNDYFQADLTRARFQDETQIYNATLEYSLDQGSLTATASLFKRDTLFDRDSSLALEAFIGLDADGAGRSIITQPKSRELQSYEVRYASDFEGPFQVLAGAFLQKERRNFRSAILGSDAQGNIAQPEIPFLDRISHTEIDELAFFGELSYAITDRLTATGGLRYYDFDLSEVSTSVTGFGGGAGSGQGPEMTSRDDGLIFKGNLAYDVSEDINIYLQVAEGFRSGGVNDQTAAAIANVTIPEGYGSDSVINYEVGFKSYLLDGKLKANLAAYWIDWSDIQLQDQASDGQLEFPYRGNGGGATIKGLEVELLAFPVERLELGLNMNISQAELNQDNPIATSGQKGDAIPYIPEFTLSASAMYSWLVGPNGMEAIVGADVNYVGGRNTELRPDSSLFIKLDDYALANARIGVETDRWSATLNLQNIFNDDTVTDVFRVISGVYPEGFIFNHPRTVMLSFSVKM
ncbi:TonB-dependent receptor [Paremcibacter congregatus]|nr:TonB-dependent receptor [Paremcibacter congregatus]